MTYNETIFCCTIFDYMIEMCSQVLHIVKELVIALLTCGSTNTCKAKPVFSSATRT